MVIRTIARMLSGGVTALIKKINVSTKVDIDKLPIELPYHLLDIDRYRTSTFPIQTSRGCPYQCGFCYNTAFYGNRKWRSKSADRVLDEIGYIIDKFNPDTISFTWEDEFFINKQRVLDICTGMVARGYDIKWESFCRFDDLDKFTQQEVAVLEMSGCSSLAFGAEGNDFVRNSIIKKGITDEQITSVTLKLGKTNIRQVVSFMCCLPGERSVDLYQLYNLIDHIVRLNPNLYINGITLYTPFPGTPLFKLITDHYGYKPPASLEECSNFKMYRNMNIPWQSGEYANKCKTLSMLSRFPFWKKTFSYSDISTIIEGARLKSPLVKFVYYLYAHSAMLRWKLKWFGFPVEYWLLEKVLLKTRGFF